MSETWTCPKCGGGSGFSLCRRVNGWEQWAYYGGRVGALAICDDAGVRRSWPQTGICLDCALRVPIS
jgi:hypothetical protein